MGDTSRGLCYSNIRDGGTRLVWISLRSPPRPLFWADGGVGEESGAGDAGVGRNCSRVLVCKRTDQGSYELMPHPDIDSRAHAGSGREWAFDLHLDMQVRYSATANRAVIGARAIQPRSGWKYTRRRCVCSQQFAVVCYQRHHHSTSEKPIYGSVHA